jgi:hypothetical protein
MSGELRPGVFTALFSRIAVEAQGKAAAALAVIGTGVERQAKINASTGSHPYGTPSPARPGTGPARISGTLVRSITHTDPVLDAFGWSMKVGTAAGLYPTYRTLSGATFTSKVPSSKYGYYLEVKGTRNGARYPFMQPAVDFATRQIAALAYQKIFGAPWNVS